MIKNAADAVEIVEQHSTFESVLADIEFAAKRGRRSWIVAWMSQDTVEELKRRGFHVDRLGCSFQVSW